MAPGPRILFAVHATSAQRDRKLPDPAFRTLCALAEYVNYTGGAAFPSIKTLAQQRGTSERSIQRHLRQLEKRGHLQTVQGRQHGTNNYFLLFNGRRRPPAALREVWEAGGQLSLFEQDAPAPAHTRPGATPSVTPEQSRGDTQCHRGGDTQCHPNKTIEHKKDSHPSDGQPAAANGAGIDPHQDLDAVLYVRGKALLGKSAGGMITELRRSIGLGAALEAIEAARHKENPREYIAGFIRANGHARPNGHGRPWYGRRIMERIAAREAHNGADQT